MGDVFENISNSTIINRSYLEGSLNKVKKDVSEDTADALRQIAEFIGKSGNEAAIENFNSFNEELQKEDASKNKLKTWWNGVTDALPGLLKMTELVAKVIALF